MTTLAHIENRIDSLRQAFMKYTGVDPYDDERVDALTPPSIEVLNPFTGQTEKVNPQPPNGGGGVDTSNSFADRWGRQAQLDTLKAYTDQLTKELNAARSERDSRCREVDEVREENDKLRAKVDLLYATTNNLTRIFMDFIRQWETGQ